MTMPSERKVVQLLSQAETTARSFDEHIARQNLSDVLSQTTLEDVLDCASNSRLARIFYAACEGLAEAVTQDTAEYFAQIISLMRPFRWRRAQHPPPRPRRRVDLS